MKQKIFIIAYQHEDGQPWRVGLCVDGKAIATMTPHDAYTVSDFLLLQGTLPPKADITDAIFQSVDREHLEPLAVALADQAELASRNNEYIGLGRRLELVM